MVHAVLIVAAGIACIQQRNGFEQIPLVKDRKNPLVIGRTAIIAVGLPNSLFLRKNSLLRQNNSLFRCVGNFVVSG